MSSDDTLRAVDLSCAHLGSRVLGVAPERVRFSWRVSGAGRDRRQTGARVLVATSLDDPERPEGTLWDSGRLGSLEALDLAYGGQALPPRTAFDWSVKVWDEENRESPWSAPAHFETTLAPEDWEGEWIGLDLRQHHMDPPSGAGPVDPVRNALGPAAYLRRSFTLDRPPRSARLYVSALGCYEARVNGARVTDAVLSPGWADYHQRVPYQSYDVTHLLEDGENVLALVLGDGWAASFYGFVAKRAGAHYEQRPLAICQLDVVDLSGHEARIASDAGWQSSTGAVRFADLLMGQRIDLFHRHPGWDRPGFDSSGWAGVERRPRDARPLVADPGPPIRVTEELPARQVRALGPGRTVVDFGQNLAGFVRLRLPAGSAGNCVLRHAEVLADDGSLYTDNLRTARAQDEVAFPALTEPVEVEPRMTFHGFRYAELSGYPVEPALDDLVACVVHSDVERLGSFECSNERVNRLYANIDWGQRGNFISVPTDCPQRDERLGWLGDAQIFVRTACYNRDVAAFFAKWIDDVHDAQLASGAYTDVAPSLGLSWAGAPAWGDAGVIVPWTIYEMFGDRAILERSFASMQAWMGFLARDNSDWLRRANLGNNYGDWLAPYGDDTPRDLLATAYWAYDAALMARIANVVGEPGAAACYLEQRQRIEDAFFRAYVGADGRMASDTQTAYVLALQMDLLPEELREAAAEHLVAAIERAGWHLATGFVGVGYLLPVLSRHGHTEVAYRLLEQDSFPSWLYTVDRGATTIWERWDGWTEEGGFQSPEMNSFNHYSLGSVGEWLYRFVLGIELAPGSAGFREIVLCPHPGGTLTSARGTYHSASGAISSAWRREGGVFHLAVDIPANTTAVVKLPSSRPEDVREAGGLRPSGVVAYDGAAGARAAAFDVGSGHYEFAGPALAVGA